MVESTSNLILRALPRTAAAKVYESCQRVDLERGATLASTGQSTSAVYFPENAVISTLANYSDGSVIEMANIGREACTGINLILGSSKQLTVEEVQVEGTALTLSASDFLELKSTLPQFERLLFLMVQAVFYQVMVSGACNGAHNAQRRLARWLLTMRDRSDREEMRLTHEFLAKILGLRRATVTEAANALHGAGLIDYQHGRMWITDRAGLESASCECYRRVRDTYDSVFSGKRRPD